MDEKIDTRTRRQKNSKKTKSGEISKTNADQIKDFISKSKKKEKIKSKNNKVKIKKLMQSGSIGEFPPIKVTIGGNDMDIYGGGKKFRKNMRATKLNQDLEKQGFNQTLERQSNSSVNPIDNANRIRAGLKGGGKVKLALRGGGRAYGQNS